MIVNNLKGGLGNYLFQIATGYSLSIENNTDFKIDLNRIWQVHSPMSLYLNTIFRKIKTTQNFVPKNLYTYDSLVYSKIPYNDDMLLDGYFQSEKYFKDYKQEILSLFEIDELSKKNLEEKYSEIINNNNTCSIHVRRGDFLLIDFYNKLNMENYYNKAIDEIGRDKLFIIFSNDIDWCKLNFKDINCVFIENQSDLLDLYLMSMCVNNITANSTFSWWGAFLNTNKNKKIVTPKIWFNHTHSNDDLIPHEWIKIN
jgi:hypothetical protein